MILKNIFLDSVHPKKKLQEIKIRQTVIQRNYRGHRGRGCMEVGLKTTYATSAYHH
jgi:hypothetical protein